MNIKRYLAKDMRTALSQVNAELGPEATILSNRKVDGGVELVVTVDFDEASRQAQSGRDAQSGNEPSTSREQDLAQRNRFTSSSGQPGGDPRSQHAHNQQAHGQHTHSRSGNQVNKPSFNLNEPDIPAGTVKARKMDSDVVSLSSKAASNLSEKAALLLNKSAGKYDSTDGDESDVSRSRIVSQLEHLTEKINSSNNRESFNFETRDFSPQSELKDEVRALRHLLEDQLNALAWHQFSNHSPLKSQLMHHLAELGLSPLITRKLCEAVDQNQQLKQAWNQSLKLLSGKLKTLPAHPLNTPGVYAFVGPTGVGKTTSIAKIAARYALKNGSDKVALITADCYRIAAHEQLNTYGRVMQVPVSVVQNEEELKLQLESYQDRDLVLIDTAGMSQRDKRLAQQFACLSADPSTPIQVLLTLSAVCQKPVLDEAIKMFSPLEPSGVVVTKLDEAGSLGELISSLCVANLPLTFYTNGQKVPDDLHMASGRQLIELAVSLAEEYRERTTDEWYLAQRAQRSGVMNGTFSTFGNGGRVA